LSASARESLSEASVLPVNRIEDSGQSQAHSGSVQAGVSCEFRCLFRVIEVVRGSFKGGFVGSSEGLANGRGAVKAKNTCECPAEKNASFDGLKITERG